MRETIKKALKAALATDHDAICQHISTKWEDASTGGIEKAFSSGFFRKLPPATFVTEVPLTDIGGRQTNIDKYHGYMDCVIDRTVGLEFKAMRLPRKIHLGHKGARYDLGQIVEDYIRLRAAKSLSGGYTVVFVYGPLVQDAATPGQLYRAFHNQLYVDHSVAEAHKQTQGPTWKAHRAITKELGIDKPLEGFGFDRNIIVVKHGSLGAIALPRDWE